MKKCLECQNKVVGRVDKIFCSPYCKSSFHHKKNMSKEQSMYLTIDKQLKLNRKLLQHYNKAGKSIIRKEVLINVGFNPKYFTHYWKNKKGDRYVLRRKNIPALDGVQQPADTDNPGLYP